MQDHAKQGYIFGHFSLTRNLALNIPSEIATVKDRESASQKKKILGALKDTSLFG